MKIFITYILSFVLWTNALAVSIEELYGNINFDSSSIEVNGASVDDSTGRINLEPDGADPYAGLTEEEIALMQAGHILAQNRADCDDGKGGIEVGVIKVKRKVPNPQKPEEEIEQLEEVDCNQVAFLQFKLLEEKLGKDKAFECTTKNWYLDEQVKFAKELELPMEKHFCEEKLKDEEKNRSWGSKAAECAGSVACNMLKTPVGEAIGFDPLADLVSFATKGTDFGKGCENTPGNGCISTALWGIFKNIFTNIEGFWDLGKMLVDGVAWAAGKVKDGVVHGVTRASRWLGDKIWGGNSLQEYDNRVAARQDVISQQEDGFLKSFMEAPVKTTGNLLTSLFTGMMDMIAEGAKDNFMCGGNWYRQKGSLRDSDKTAQQFHSAENREYKNMASRAGQEIYNFGGDVDAERHDKIRCDKPFIAECASCGQWMNMLCGVIGFLGGEVITAVLTGGAVNVIGKSASALSKGGKAISAALRSTNKWDEFVKLGKTAGGGAKNGAFKGLEAMKGAWRGGSEIIGNFTIRGASAGLMKGGKNLAFAFGKKVYNLPANAADSLLAAMRRGKMQALEAGSGRLGTALKMGKEVALAPMKAYLQALDDAFVLGMQGKEGLRIARLARESDRIRKEMKPLQALAEQGNDSAKQLLAAHQRRLNILHEHSELTKRAMGSTDEVMRRGLLEDAKRKAAQLDQSVNDIKTAERGFINNQNQIKLAKESSDNGSTIVKGHSTTVSGRSSADDLARVKNMDELDDAAGGVATTGMRNRDTSYGTGTISRKPATLSDDVAKINPKIVERVDELKSLKSPGGAEMTDMQQSFARAILNNADPEEKAALIKKIAEEGWDSVRRTCN